MMKQIGSTKKHFLPAYFRGARCVRYVSPVYDYEEEYEDEYGEWCQGDRYCVNEDECTDHLALAKQVAEDGKPLYFFRRTMDQAKWSKQHLSSLVRSRKLPLTIARFNRRILIINSDEHKKITSSMLKKIDNKDKSKYNTNLYHNMKVYFEREINFD